MLPWGRPESYPGAILRTQDPTGGAGATPRHLRYYVKRYGASAARQGRPEAYPGAALAPCPAPRK